MKYFLFSLFVIFSLNSFCSSKFININEITVKISDKNSLIAKQKALSNAQNLAFSKLIIVQYPEVNYVKDKISLNQIQECIYDYSIEEEKFTEKIYMAEFSFRFSKEKLKHLFKSYGINSDEDEMSVIMNNSLVVYTKDFLNHFNLFQNVSIKRFSARRMILQISKQQKDILKNNYIKFAEIND